MDNQLRTVELRQEFYQKSQAATPNMDTTLPSESLDSRLLAFKQELAVARAPSSDQNLWDMDAMEFSILLRHVASFVPKEMQLGPVGQTRQIKNLSRCP